MTQSKIRIDRTHEHDVHSQNGEDGILKVICAALGIERGTAVEFGAWDGVHLSNTAQLRTLGWKSVLIEGDAARAFALRKLENENTIAIHALVEPDGTNSLDSILDRHAIDHVDVVSIDIDGGDLQIFEKLRRRARVVCVEFNPGIPPPHVFRNPAGTCKGSSLAALAEVAAAKAYELVYATYCNAFFVRREDSPCFDVYDAYRAFHLWPRPAIGFTFDGEFLTIGGREPLIRHPWSTVPLFVPRLPRMLLGWPPTRLRVLLSYLYFALSAPFFYLWHLLKEVVHQLGIAGRR